MVFILVAVFSFITPHSLAATDYYRVCCNNSRIRAVASTTGKVLATVNKGNDLDSNDTSYIYSTNDWTYVTYNSVSGYIRNDLICPKGSSRRVIVSAGLTFEALAIRHLLLSLFSHMVNTYAHSVRLHNHTIIFLFIVERIEEAMASLCLLLLMLQVFPE